MAIYEMNFTLNLIINYKCKLFMYLYDKYFLMTHYRQDDCTRYGEIKMKA